MKVAPATVFMVLLLLQTAQGKDIRVEMAKPANINSNCSEDQIKDQLFRVLQPLKSMEAPASQLFGFQDGNCRIQGMIRKTKTGYEFQPNYGQSLSPGAVMKFHSLAEIVQLVKSTQVSSGAIATPASHRSRTLETAPAPSSSVTEEAESPPADTSTFPSDPPPPPPLPTDTGAYSGPSIQSSPNPFGRIKGAQ